MITSKITLYGTELTVTYSVIPEQKAHWGRDGGTEYIPEHVEVHHVYIGKVPIGLSPDDAIRLDKLCLEDYLDIKNSY